VLNAAYRSIAERGFVARSLSIHELPTYQDVLDRLQKGEAPAEWPEETAALEWTRTMTPRTGFERLLIAKAASDRVGTDAVAVLCAALAVHLRTVSGELGAVVRVEDAFVQAASFERGRYEYHIVDSWGKKYMTRSMMPLPIRAGSPPVNLKGTIRGVAACGRTILKKVRVC